tara:strand:- start:731 stop:940 length:210 start_codon:yes stop_codon:yes gene_type:complete
MNPIIQFVSKIMKYIAIIIVASLLMYFLYIIFQLLGITIEVYGNYLIWAIAMGIFYLTLPKHSAESIFS